MMSWWLWPGLSCLDILGPATYARPRLIPAIIPGGPFKRVLLQQGFGRSGVPDPKGQPVMVIRRLG